MKKIYILIPLFIIFSIIGFNEKAFAEDNIYTNPRYGYSFSYPAELSVHLQLPGKEGVIISSSDRKFVIAAVARNLYQDRRLVNYYIEDLKKVNGVIATSILIDGKYAIVWIEGNFAYHKTIFSGAKSQNELIISYPVAEMDTYHPVSEKIIESFIHGDINSAH